MQVGRTLWLAVFLIIVLCGQQVRAAKPTILVVESYNVEMEWDVSYKQALEETLETLGQKYKLEYTGGKRDLVGKAGLTKKVSARF